jgi:hypothetical protein
MRSLSVAQYPPIGQTHALPPRSSLELQARAEGNPPGVPTTQKEIPDRVEGAWMSDTAQPASAIDPCVGDLYTATQVSESITFKILKYLKVFRWHKSCILVCGRRLSADNSPIFSAEYW